MQSKLGNFCFANNNEVNKNEGIYTRKLYSDQKAYCLKRAQNFDSTTVLCCGISEKTELNKILGIIPTTQDCCEE